jgi:hypothetical protein
MSENDLKKSSPKKIAGFVIAFIFIALGIMMHYLKIGEGPYLGFASVGIWLSYVGFIALTISVVRMFRKKERFIDERMLAIAAKANRIVFLSVIIAAFIIMILDGIKTIMVPLGLFMSYIVMGMMLVYFVSYKILLKFN